MRQLSGVQRIIVDFIAAGFAFYFLFAIATTQPFYITIPLYLCLSYVLVFSLYPALGSSPKSRLSVPDILFCLVTVGFTAFFYYRYSYYVAKPGLLLNRDIVAAVIAVILSLEVCRRVLGLALPILALLGIAYAFWGSVIPGALGHRGFSLFRVMGQLYSFDGIYGSVTAIYSTYVLLFVIFGAVIQATGMGTFLFELSNALVGRFKGGTAKGAVMSSGLIGMVMGSGAANVAVTGSFTIPLMKRVGYPPHIAGAIETVASGGGVLLPPVMGSAAFVLAAFAQVPYSEVALYSLLPGLLFFWGIYIQVHALSRRLDIGQVTERPSLGQVLLSGGHMLVPIVLVFTLIFSGMTAYRAGLWAIASTILMHYVRPVAGMRRMRPLELISAFGDGAKLQLTVGASAGVIGIVIAMLVLPGLPLKIASFAVEISQGNLLVLLFLMMIVSYIFGMGIPMVAAYIVLAVIAVPALTALDVPLFNAHLIIMWFSLASFWTPPVAVGAFVASGIAGGRPDRIGWYSVRLGVGLYVIPFLMAFGTIINGTLPEILFSGVAIAASLYCLAATVEGYMANRLSALERLAYAAAGVASLLPVLSLRLAGLTALLILVLLERRRSAALARASSEPSATTYPEPSPGD